MGRFLGPLPLQAIFFAVSGRQALLLLQFPATERFYILLGPFPENTKRAA